MNNIEKLAREHGSTCYTGQEYHFERWELEAFAKALQSSEPVAEVRCRNGEVFGYIPSRLLRDMLPLGTKLFTHPPASVPLEKYNKLLDALKFYADENNHNDQVCCGQGNWSGNPNEPPECCGYPVNSVALDNGKRAQQAIAEAEGKEG